jgi:hypothetical protein
VLAAASDCAAVELAESLAPGAAWAWSGPEESDAPEGEALELDAVESGASLDWLACCELLGSADGSPAALPPAASLLVAASVLVAGPAATAGGASASAGAASPRSPSPSASPSASAPTRHRARCVPPRGPLPVDPAAAVVRSSRPSAPDHDGCCDRLEVESLPAAALEATVREDSGEAIPETVPDLTQASFRAAHPAVNEK